MTAICTKGFLEYTSDGLIVYELGDLTGYSRKGNQFVVNGIEIPSAKFFNYFKVITGYARMNYYDFEYILCNYVFDMAVLFPEEYNGIRNLIIQDWNGKVIMITVNANEDVIRVSFDDAQKKYSSYEEALDGIKNHK
jgi:hypothetical protein